MENPQNPLTIKRRIAFSQTDAAGLIHFTTYFTLMEEAEAELFRLLGIPLLQKDSTTVCGYPRVDCQCKFIRPVRFDDLVRVELGIAEIRANRIHYQVSFFNPAGELCAQGSMVTAFVSGDHCGKLSASRMPEAARRALEEWKNTAT